MAKYYPEGSSQYEALMNEAVDLVWAIVLHDIEPREGCKRVGEICESLGWPEELTDLGSIAPELQRLDANGLPTEPLIDNILHHAEKLYPDFLHARHGRKEEDLTREAVLLSRWILDERTEPREAAKRIGKSYDALFCPAQLEGFGNINEGGFKKIDGEWEFCGEDYDGDELVAAIMEEARLLIEWYENKRKTSEKR